VIASLIGACITLFVGTLTYRGVRLTVRRAHERMVAELADARDRASLDRTHAGQESARDREHAAEEAQKQRVMDARLAVYSKLMEEFGQVAAMLGKLPSLLEAGEDTNKPMLDFGTSVNKAWLLSSADTAYLTREMHSKLNETYFRCLGRAKEVRDAANDVSAADAGLRQAEHDLSKVLEKLSQYPVTHQSLESAGLRGTAHRLREDRDKARSAKVSAELARNALLLSYGTDVVEETRPLLGLVHDLVLHARLELGLTGDSQKLREQTAGMQERAKAAYERLASAIKGSR
jgi:hypothetical protein